MTVDRDVLIDAVATAYVGQDETLLRHARPLIAAVLDQALPLIADYIEDELTRPYKVPGDPESYFATTDTWNNAVETAARRIRMLVPASTERI